MRGYFPGSGSVKASHRRLAVKAFSKLGCTKTEIKRLVTITSRLMNKGIRDYVNHKGDQNAPFMKKRFSVTQPRVDILNLDEIVTKQLLAKSENFSNWRVETSAQNCMYVVLDEILGDFNYAELVIGGAKNRILTAESDLDVPVVTNCPSWGECQLATVSCIVALSELANEIPCGACTRVFNEEQMLTNSSLSQHYVKTAILIPEPIYDSEAFFIRFEEKSYDKLIKMLGDEEAVSEVYCEELGNYSAKIRRKIGNSPRVKVKDILKVMQNDLTSFFALTRGINAVRGNKFNELYKRASRIHPSLVDIEPLLGSMLKHAGGDPDNAISTHKILKQISGIFDILQVIAPQKL